MKTHIVLAVSAVFLFDCCSSNGASSYGKDYAIQLTSLGCLDDVSASLPENIQVEIKNVFVKSLMSKDDSAFIKLNKTLENAQKKTSQNILNYWIAYLKYYHSIYYLQFKDKGKSEKLIHEGIDILEDFDKKNSEDYALLSLMKSFSIQFEKGMKVPFVSSKVKKYGELAIKLDATNLRAYYVMGSNDFYTPAQYGGQTKTEDFLLKAISLPDQKIQNKYLPSWGKEEAYEMLIKYYINKEEWNKAKDYYIKASELYPNNYMIQQLASKLVGK